MENNKPIRVLHILRGMNQGGAENLLMNIYRKIDRDKVQFDFAVSIEEEGFFDQEIISYGGKIYRVGNNKKLISYTYNLINILKNNPQIKVVHSHVHHFTAYNAIICKLIGSKKLIAHSHNTQSGKQNTICRNLYEILSSTIINIFATYRIGCSKDAAIALFGEKNINKKNVKIIHNGIDLERFKTKGTVKSDKNIQFVHVGRFEEQKNHKFLIECFYELNKLQQNIHLTLVGVGSLLEDTKKDIKRYNLEDKVSILSLTKNIEDVLQDKNYFVFPSLFEGVGIVLIEAQAMEIPCYVSDTVPIEAQLGLCEFLPLEKGPKYWAEIIFKQVNNENNRKADDNLLANYSIDKTINDLNEIYMAN